MGTTDGAPASDALARCVGDVDGFLAEHWGRRALLRPSADAGGFADLLSLDDVDHLLSSAGLRAPAFRLVSDGTPLPPAAYLRRARVGSRPIADLIDVGKVYAAFDDGATIVLQGLHRYWPEVTRFCRDLELVLTHPVQANAYLTPPTNQGLNVHADAHDVFALQTHGKKRWVVYTDGPDAEPDDVTLEPGDSFYLPAGTQHAARTVEAASLHLTIGVRSDTWRSAISRAVEATLSDDVFDGALPAGYAHDPAGLEAGLAARLRELALRVEKADVADLADDTARRFLATRTPSLDGQLVDLLAVDQITDATLLRRRRGAVAHLRRAGDQMVLTLGDRVVRLPRRAESALREVLSRDELRPADLPGLDEAGRLVLARRLVREGLLRRAGAS